MRVGHLGAGWDQQGRTDISVAALLQVGLQQQALHFPAFVQLLRLDVVEGEAQGAGGGQPELEQSELDRSGGRVQAEGCGVHIPTVLLPEVQCHLPVPVFIPNRMPL